MTSLNYNHYFPGEKHNSWASEYNRNLNTENLTDLKF